MGRIWEERCCEVVVESRGAQVGAGDCVGHGDPVSWEMFNLVVNIADGETSTLTREIKADTQEILNDTSAIKQDTAQILAEIARLQEQLPRDMNQRSAGFMLERYLDNLTNYAETVCDPFLDGSGGSRPTSRPGSSGEDALVNQCPNALPQEFHELILGEPSVSMMTPSPTGKFQIENDEEGTHRNMQEHGYRPAGFDEPRGGDGPASSSSIGSSARPRKSFTGDTMPLSSDSTLVGTHLQSSTDSGSAGASSEEKKEGPLEWIKNKMRERREEREKERNKSPPASTERLGSFIPNRGKSIEVKREENPEGTVEEKAISQAQQPHR